MNKKETTMKIDGIKNEYSGLVLMEDIELSKSDIDFLEKEKFNYKTMTPALLRALLYNNKKYEENNRRMLQRRSS